MSHETLRQGHASTPAEITPSPTVLIERKNGTIVTGSARENAQGGYSIHYEGEYGVPLKRPSTPVENLTEKNQERLARELAGAALLGDTIFVPRKNGTIIQATLQRRENPVDGADTVYVRYEDPETGQPIEKNINNTAAISDEVQGELAKQFEEQQRQAQASVGHANVGPGKGRFGNGVIRVDKVGPQGIRQAAALGSLPIGPDGRPYIPRGR